MSKGIFNPFSKPKKKFTSPVGDTPWDTESEEPSKGNVRLDGDSYVLEFENAVIEDIPARLGSLIASVAKDHRGSLIQAGIDLIPRGATRKLEDSELMLPTPDGFLSVYVDSEKTEVEAFRRIAHALHRLPIKDILKAQRARITTRA